MISRIRHGSYCLLERMFHRIKSFMHFSFEKCFCQRTIDFLSPEAFHFSDVNICLFSLYLVENSGYFWVYPAPIVKTEFRVVVVHFEAVLAVPENAVDLAEENKRRG